MKENRFSLVKYDKKYNSSWDRVARNSKNGNFLHVRDYMDYHANRFDEQSVIVFKGGTPVAVFPCNRAGDQLISHAGLTYAGLVYGRDLHAIEVIEIFEYLAQYYRKIGIRRVLYKAIPHIFHRYPSDEDLYALTRMDACLIRRDLASVIRLNDRVGFSRSRHRNIRKAQTTGVEFREGEFIQEYHALLSQVLAKFGVKPVHTAEELCVLRGRFCRNIRLFGAFDRSKMLAGALIYDFSNVIHVQYGSTSEEGRMRGALDLIYSRLIEDIFAARQYFSFGKSTEADADVLNEGLISQKEAFGGRGVVHDVYEWNVA